jgi:hypothetical protein
MRSLLTGLPLPAALLAASLVFVLQPSLCYDSSLEFPLLPALVSLATCGLIIAVLVALPGALGRQRWRDDYGAFLTAIAIGLWGSSLLSLGSPVVLDGRLHEISPDFGAVIANILVVLTISACAYAISRRRTDTARFFLWALNALFAVTAITVVAKTPADTNPYRADLQRLATFSSSGNVLLVLLDSYQSALFEELLVQEPGLEQEFEGFAYFPNANSSAPTTLFSIPAIHSGKVYSPEDAARRGFDEYFSTAVEERSFLADLSKSDYRVQLLNPILHRCPRGVECYQEYILHMGRGESILQSSLFLLGLSLYTVAPLQWKQFVYDGGNWLVGGDAMRSQVTRGYETLAWLSGNVHLDDGPPTAKFLHLFTTHLPPALDEKCVETKHSRFTEKVLLDQARCTNAAILKLLSVLRSKGIYKSSMIVVFADHGTGIANDGFFTGGRASPLLLVKKPGSSGPLTIDQSLVSLTQIKSMVCETTKGCPDSFALSLDGGERLFTDYRWDAEVWTRRDKHAVTWYQIEGPPTRLESWRRVAPSVPPVRSLRGNEDDPSEIYGLGWAEVAKADEKSYWSFAPVSSLFLNLPDNRPYSVSIVLENIGVPSPDLGLEVLVDSERMASQALSIGPRPDVRLTVMGRADRPIELRLRTTGIPEEEYSLDRRKPRYRIVQLQVD